jgi:hypothetical protein
VAVVCRAIEDCAGPILDPEFGLFDSWTHAHAFAAKLNEGLELDPVGARQIITSALPASASLIRFFIRSAPISLRTMDCCTSRPTLSMIDVWIPTVDQRWLILPRYTQPSLDTKLLIEKLKLQLPSQPLPRLVAQKQSYEIEAPTLR